MKYSNRLKSRLLLIIFIALLSLKFINLNINLNITQISTYNHKPLVPSTSACFISVGLSDQSAIIKENSSNISINSNFKSQPIIPWSIVSYKARYKPLFIPLIIIIDIRSRIASLITTHFEGSKYKDNKTFS